jgi:hypothetical protein
MSCSNAFSVDFFIFKQAKIEEKKFDPSGVNYWGEKSSLIKLMNEKKT